MAQFSVFVRGAPGTKGKAQSWCPTVPLAWEHPSDFSHHITVLGDSNLASSLLREGTAGLLCFSNREVYFGGKVRFPGEVLLLPRFPLICATNEKAGSLAAGAQSVRTDGVHRLCPAHRRRLRR